MDNVYVLRVDRTLEADARAERLVDEHQVVQDAFFAAYRVLRADPARPLTAGWLYEMATNHSITYLRKKAPNKPTNVL